MHEVGLAGDFGAHGSEYIQIRKSPGGIQIGCVPGQGGDLDFIRYTRVAGERYGDFGKNLKKSVLHFVLHCVAGIS